MNRVQTLAETARKDLEAYVDHYRDMMRTDRDLDRVIREDEYSIGLEIDKLLADCDIEEFKDTVLSFDTVVLEAFGQTLQLIDTMGY